jgi:hypothetical protein
VLNSIFGRAQNVIAQEDDGNEMSFSEILCLGNDGVVYDLFGWNVCVW